MKSFVLTYLLYTLAVISTGCPCAPVFADEINIAQLRKDAQRGNPQAQTSLAMAYHDGTDGLEKNDKKAVEWFSKAAEQGDIEGQYNMGIAYYRGFGVKKDLTVATSWFQKAAEQGYADAEYILACAYQNGAGGLPKDFVQADLWLALAEAHGKKEAGSERIALEGDMPYADIAQAKKLIQVKLPNQPESAH